MRPASFIYNTRQILSSAMMIMTLVWLTVSLPVVTKYQRVAIPVKTSSTTDKGDKESNNPFANTTEEKNPTSSNTIAEEFLHESYTHTEHLPLPVKYNKCTHPAVYVAYHGELLSPPPEV